jgi:hypothetical protein
MILFASLILVISWQKYRLVNLPQPNVSKLSRHRSGWLLHDQKGQQTPYDTVELAFNGGIFLILHCKMSHSKLTLIVFHDQLTSQEQRLLILSQKT